MGFGQHFSDASHGFQGVGIGVQADGIGHGVHAIHLTDDTVVTGTKLYPGYIFYPEQVAVIIFDNDVLEFVRGGQTAFNPGRILEFLVLFRRPGTNGTCRGLDVLTLDGGLDIRCGYPQLRHLHRIQPNSHGQFRAVLADVGNALDSL